MDRCTRRVGWGLKLGLLLGLACLLACHEETREQLTALRARPASSGPIAVEAELDGQGGTLTLLGGASVAVPEGALKQPTRLGISRHDLSTLASLPAGVVAASSAYALVPTDQTFRKAVALQLAYREPDGRSVLQLLRLDDARDLSWQSVSATIGAGVARASSLRFGIFVVVSEPAAALPDAAVAFDAGFSDASTADASMVLDASTADASAADASIVLDAATVLDGSTFDASTVNDGATPLDADVRPDAGLALDAGKADGSTPGDAATQPDASKMPDGPAAEAGVDSGA